MIITWIGRAWAATVVIAAAIWGAIAVREWWGQAARARTAAFAELDARRHLAAITPAAPDLEFLGPPGGCAWCCDLNSPGDPRNCRCDEPCQGIDWCNAGGWTTNLIPAVKEDGHG